MCRCTALRQGEEVTFVADLDLGEEGFIVWEVAHDEKVAKGWKCVQLFLSLYLVLEYSRGH